MEKQLLGPGSRVRHPAYGDGVIVKLHVAAYGVCFMQHGMKLVGKEYHDWQVIDALPAEEPVTFNEAEKSLIKILKTWSDISEVVPLGDKWDGGVMILKPEDESLKPKEIPIDAFFHKIIMIRDRMRVLEQRINSHDKLTDEDKFNIQQYITRVYGSLTTFNVLFKNKEDNFIGEKS